MNRLLLFVIALYLTLTVALGIVNPLFEAPDEQHHFFNARQLAASWRLPVAEPNTLARQEAAQPPLYYIIAAIVLTPFARSTDTAISLLPNPYARPGDFAAQNNFNAFIHTAMEGWPWQGLALEVHLIRLVSTLIGAITLWTIYQSSSALWPAERQRALLSTALVALLPQFQFIHAAVTNDTLLILFSSLALWQLIRLGRAEVTNRRILILGITIGCAILTKMTGLLLMPLATFTLVLLTYHRCTWRWLPKQIALLLLPALLLSGWLFVRNWRLYGDVTAASVFIEFAGGDQHFSLALILHNLDRVWASAIAVFGWMNVTAPLWVYRIWDVIIALAAFGLLLSLVRIDRWEAHHQTMAIASEIHGQRAYAATFIVAAPLFLWPLLVVAAWLQFFTHTPADQGRLLFPAILPVALLIAQGLSQWRSRLADLIVLSAALSTSVFTVGYLLPTTYAQPQMITTANLWFI